MQTWKKLTLSNAGLQSTNIELVALLKKRRTAYGLLAFFPLGLHRSYLLSPGGAWAYRGVSFAALLTGWLLGWTWGLAVLSLTLFFALYDLRWVDDRVAQLNKAARLKVYRKPDLAAPKEFRGHYVDSDTQDATLASARKTNRIPSFSEQEAMLKELQKSRQKK